MRCEPSRVQPHRMPILNTRRRLSRQVVRDVQSQDVLMTMESMSAVRKIPAKWSSASFRVAIARSARREQRFGNHYEKEAKIKIGRHGETFPLRMLRVDQRRSTRSVRGRFIQRLAPFGHADGGLGKRTVGQGAHAAAGSI